MERSRALLFPVYLEIFELQKFVELEPQQVGNFWEISLIFVYGYQWFWSKFCPEIPKNQWKINACVSTQAFLRFLLWKGGRVVVTSRTVLKRHLIFTNAFQWRFKTITVPETNLTDSYFASEAARIMHSTHTQAHGQYADMKRNPFKMLWNTVFGAKLHDLWANFFWLNWSPWCFYRIPSDFLLRPDKIKSNGVTVFDFRFFVFFFTENYGITRKIVSWVPQKPPESDIWGFWGTHDTKFHKYHDFPRKKTKKSKIESRHAIGFYFIWP